MRYTLVDDSIPFDGHTAARRPLGGAEKAIAYLAAALARRGHTVTVLNRASYPSTAEGVRYLPLDDIQERPTETDVVIASRQPSLLGTVRKAGHRLLWAVAAPAYLEAPANAPLWESFKPALLFISPSQQRTYRGALPHRVLAPGVAAAFYSGDDVPAPLRPRVPPHAVVTTHPLHGLAWLVEIWRRLIHPQMPEARMVVYSALLTKGLKDEPIPEAIVPILDRIKSASAANVVVAEPRGDTGMAEVYRASRLHFYPGHAQDFACWTMAESQAAGTPAVARGVGGVEEHIVNGQSGFIVPDAAAFANVALEILRNDPVHASLSATASDIARRRTWDMAANDLDDIVAVL